MEHQTKNIKPKYVGPYKVLSFIGNGASAEVYQGFDEKEKGTVALKFVKREHLLDKTKLQMFEREVRMAERVKHKNIVSFHNIYFLDDYIVLAMEYLENGTLSNIKFCSLFSIKQEVYLRWGKDILEGLQYLHNKGIAHHDIKPDNIGFDDMMNAKILDLGLCEEFRENCYNKSGTLLFSAPEVLMDEKYDGAKADIWSFGVTFHYMVTGYLPFYNYRKCGNYLNREEIEENISITCPAPISKIVDMALTIDPKLRPSASDILELSIFDASEKPPVLEMKAKPLIKPPQRKTIGNIIVKPLNYSKKHKLTRRFSSAAAVCMK